MSEARPTERQRAKIMAVKAAAEARLDGLAPRQAAEIRHAFWHFCVKIIGAKPSHVALLLQVQKQNLVRRVQAVELRAEECSLFEAFLDDVQGHLMAGLFNPEDEAFIAHLDRLEDDFPNGVDALSYALAHEMSSSDVEGMFDRLAAYGYGQTERRGPMVVFVIAASQEDHPHFIDVVKATQRAPVAETSEVIGIKAISKALTRYLEEAPQVRARPAHLRIPIQISQGEREGLVEAALAEGRVTRCAPGSAQNAWRAEVAA